MDSPSNSARSGSSKPKSQKTGTACDFVSQCTFSVMIDAPRNLESFRGSETQNRKEKMCYHALDQISRDPCAEPSIELSQHGVSISFLRKSCRVPLFGTHESLLETFRF